MRFGICQIIYLILISISLAIAIIKHGQSAGNYNAYIAILITIIELTLLICGGFFG